MVKSNHMERASFYGVHSEEDKRSWRQALRTLPLVQGPGDVAAAVYDLAHSKRAELVVGPAFQLAAAAYHSVGLNPSAVPFMT